MSANTPASPPRILAKKIVQGDKPNANPVGIARYISKVARLATVSIFNNMIKIYVDDF